MNFEFQNSNNSQGDQLFTLADLESSQKEEMNLNQQFNHYKQNVKNYQKIFTSQNENKLNIEEIILQKSKENDIPTSRFFDTEKSSNIQQNIDSCFGKLSSLNDDIKNQYSSFGKLSSQNQDKFSSIQNQDFVKPSNLQDKQSPNPYSISLHSLDKMDTSYPEQTDFHNRMQQYRGYLQEMPLLQDDNTVRQLFTQNHLENMGNLNSEQIQKTQLSLSDNIKLCKLKYYESFMPKSQNTTANQFQMIKYKFNLKNQGRLEENFYELEQMSQELNNLNKKKQNSSNYSMESN